MLKQRFKGDLRSQVTASMYGLYTSCAMKKPFLLYASILGLGAFAAGASVGAETLLVANQKDASLSVIDTASAKVVATIPVEGITGHEVAVSPDGKTAYVPIYGNAGVGRAGTDGTEMAVIDLSSHKVVHKVDFGHGVRPHCPDL